MWGSFCSEHAWLEQGTHSRSCSMICSKHHWKRPRENVEESGPSVAGRRINFATEETLAERH